MATVLVAVVVGGASLAAAQAAPFVPAPAKLRAACIATARAVGYAVPCPTRIPAGLVAYGGRSGCELPIIGPARPCPNTQFLWRGWVVGSSVTPTEHLVITASPRAIADDAKLVNGPAWRPGERVRLLGRTTIGKWRVDEVFVPPSLNEGSAFAGHVVLVWTVGRHTYGVGFHDVSTIRQTFRLDLALARATRLVGPRG
ncbi:MAG TPA: hypothetical protein VFA05_04750 [Gaiellaceae bacterium]|nr:hypothetical protein [Gaiellaceae bacterium]